MTAARSRSVALASPTDVVDKAAYVLANPVAAGLVRREKDWPGLWSGLERIGGAPITAKRPEGFFPPRHPPTPTGSSCCGRRDRRAVGLHFGSWS